MSFSCTHADEFRNETYAEASAGLIMQVQELSVSLRVISFAIFLYMLAIQDGKHNEAVKTA